MATSPILSILKIEDLTSEESAKDVLSESEVCSMGDDQDDEIGFDEEMIDIDESQTKDLFYTSVDSNVRTEHKSVSEDGKTLSSSDSREKYKLRTNPNQFEAMLDFMVAHQALAKGNMGATELRTVKNDLWNELTLILNSNGPPVRSQDGWKKVWGDYKSSIRAKVRKNKSFYQVPRGWPKKLLSMSRQEKRVANLLGFTQAEPSSDVATLPRTLIINPTQMPPPVSSIATVNNNKSPINSSPAVVNNNRSSINSEESLHGRPSLIITKTPVPTPSPVAVVNKNSNSMKNDEENNSDEPSNSRYSPPLSRKYKKLLLQAQIDTQKDFAKDSKNILIAINDNLKGLLNVSVKNYDLQQTRLKLEKEKFLFKQKAEAHKQKFELEKLQLQKDILRLKQEIAGIIH